MTGEAAGAGPIRYPIGAIYVKEIEMVWLLCAVHHVSVMEHQPCQVGLMPQSKVLIRAELALN